MKSYMPIKTLKQQHSYNLRVESELESLDFIKRDNEPHKMHTASRMLYASTLSFI